MKDEREIKRAKLPGFDYWHCDKASKFERFERPGEYCMLPWLRVYDNLQGVINEVPLAHVDGLEYYQ